MTKEIQLSPSESLVFRESTHPVRIAESASDALRSQEVFFRLLQEQSENGEIKAIQEILSNDHASVVIHDMKDKIRPPTFEVIEREDGAKHLAIAVPAQFHLFIINEQNESEYKEYLRKLCWSVVRRYETLVEDGERFMNSDECLGVLKGKMEEK